MARCDSGFARAPMICSFNITPSRIIPSETAPANDVGIVTPRAADRACPVCSSALICSSIFMSLFSHVERLANARAKLTIVPNMVFSVPLMS